jgi:uncharacterized Fe-S cluster-containing radical SAM superfamily protein
MAIDPVIRGRQVVERLTGKKAPYIDKPMFAVYKARPFKDGNQWGDAYIFDLFGCNMNCAHCYGHSAGLAANLDSDFAHSRLGVLPGGLKGKLIHSPYELYEQVDSSRTEIDTIEFSGGETTLYRRGLRDVGRLAQKDGRGVAVNTNGLLIARHKNYLDAFEGLQDTMSFMVSIKGTTPEEFERFTGAKGRFYDAPFAAIEKLLERGFLVYPGGITLNMFANKKELAEADNPVTRLHARLSAIHPELPRFLCCHTVTYGYVYEPAVQLGKMRRRGYVNNSPSAVKEALDKYFREQGTPIIEFLPENKGLPGKITKKPRLEELAIELS